VTIVSRRSQLSRSPKTSRSSPQFQVSSLMLQAEIAANLSLGALDYVSAVDQMKEPMRRQNPSLASRKSAHYPAMPLSSCAFTRASSVCTVGDAAGEKDHISPPPREGS
jgi:hypothetical protein